MVLGKKVAIFDWEWGRNWPLEKGRKCAERVGGKEINVWHHMQYFILVFTLFKSTCLQMG